MSRNRDLNGNGRIDENEVRWFLASLNEYIRMGIGANAISSAAQLYIGDKIMMNKGSYPSSYISEGSLFYTSSASDKRVYWAVEKGSYGSVNEYSGNGPFPIRCIRNLPATIKDDTSGEVLTDISSIEDITSDPTYIKHDASGNVPIILEFKDRLVSSLYRQRVSGALNVHNEDDDANSFYDGIFVASDFLDNTYSLGEIIGYTGYTWKNPCARYSEGGYTNWRVPNLVELSAMNAAGLLNRCTSTYIAASCTQFTNLQVRYGFGRSELIYCPGTNGVSDLEYGYHIRCVRDVPANYTFPTN